MMMGLNAPLREGDHIKATLTFEKAGSIDVEFAVEAQGANLKSEDLERMH
jgi:copper(I)-binding protein